MKYDADLTYLVDWKINDGAECRYSQPKLGW